MKVVLFPNFKKENAYDCSLRASDILHDLGIEITAGNEFKEKLCVKDYIKFGDFDLLVEESDAVIAIGGDGTILKCANKMNCQKPILGINSGRLGFMASVERDELSCLSRLKSGEYNIETRMMMDIYHCNNLCEEKYTALNDVVIACPYSKINDFVVKSNGSIVTELRADGLVFSTPTGSTAYSLSAGGPILEPDLECIEFTPICPHSLFSRTIIFSPSNMIEVNHDSDDKNMVFFSIDGADGILMKKEDKIVIKKSQKSIRLLDLKKGMFYDAVNNKLMKTLKGI